MRAAQLILSQDGSAYLWCQVMTSYTDHHDVWHQTWLLLDSNGQGLAPPFFADGPDMTQNDNPLWHTWEVSFPAGTFDSSIFHKVVFVQWDANA